MSRPAISHEDYVYSDGRHVWEHSCTGCGLLVAVTEVGEGTRPVYDECACTLAVDEAG